MNIGLLKEIKTTEQRVLLVPEAVKTLVESGHTIFVETGAGIDAGFSDSEYESAGAEIYPTSEKIFKLAKFIVKVLPPMPIELDLYTRDHISLSFLMISNTPDRAKSLLKRESSFFSAELIEDQNGYHPILGPMSELAAHMAFTQAGKYLEKHYGGKGIFLGKLKGLNPCKMTVIGSGTVGRTLIEKALNCGVEVFVPSKAKENLDSLSSIHNSKNLHIFNSTKKKLQSVLKITDVLISAVWQNGQKAQILVKDDDVRCMSPGSVIIDLSIDHGGSIETAHPTTHDEPIYTKHNVIHYCVPNIPSALPKTASEALSLSALPFIKNIADIGFADSLYRNSTLKSGLTFYHDKVVNKTIAQSLGYEYYNILELLELNI